MNTFSGLGDDKYIAHLSIFLNDKSIYCSVNVLKIFKNVTYNVFVFAYRFTFTLNRHTFRYVPA